MTSSFLQEKQAGYRLMTTYWCNSYFRPYSCKERVEPKRFKPM